MLYMVFQNTQWDWVPVVHSGSLLFCHILCDFHFFTLPVYFPFPVSFSHFSIITFWDLVLNKPLDVNSLSQCLHFSFQGNTDQSTRLTHTNSQTNTPVLSDAIHMTCTDIQASIHFFFYFLLLKVTHFFSSK